MTPLFALVVDVLAWWKSQQTYRLLFVLIFTLLVIYFIYLVRGILLSFLLAVVLAYILHPLVRRVENRGTSRTLSILAVYLVVFILVAGPLLYGTPLIMAQLHAIIDKAPDYAAQVQKIAASLQVEYAQAGIPEPLRQSIDQRIEWLEQVLVDQTERVLEIILNLAGYFFNLVLAPIIAFYLLKDVELFTDKAVLFIPASWRPEALALGREISRVIDSFVRGYLLVSIITGTLSGLALASLGVDFALMLGIFAGITNLIPYFGPFIGAIPAVVVAFLVSKWLALKVVIVYLVIQQVEASVISPKILGDRVGLHPLFVILVLLAGGQLFGLTGLIIAVPVAAILRVLIGFARLKIFPGGHC